MEAKRSWWHQITRHPVRTVLITFLAVVVVLIILSILGYIYNWDWTGLGPYVSPPHSKDSDFQRSKTMWDWLQLLIIPAVLAVAGYLINLTISRNEQEATKQHAQSEREAAEKRAETERIIAQDNQREAALQEYIDKMSELFLHEGLLLADSKKAVQDIAQVQTKTILRRLDADRKGIVIQFLYDTGLIQLNLEDDELEYTLISLNKVDLYGSNLSGAYLSLVNLHGAFLCEASLNRSYLDFANLSSTNLAEADLSRAYLHNTDLSGANLGGANLRDADMKDAKNITIEELEKQTKSLKGATMPDGSIHE